MRNQFRISEESIREYESVSLTVTQNSDEFCYDVLLSGESRVRVVGYQA